MMTFNSSIIFKFHFIIRRFIFVPCVLCLVSIPAYAGINSDVRQGNKFYAQQDFQKSYEKYQEALQKDQESGKINFNAGTSAYKLEKYKEAADYFQKALLTDQPKLREKAHYNLGNAFYRQGEQVGPENPQAALPFLEKSLTQYEQAIKLNTEDLDAKRNHTFVKKVIEKVKEQIKKQKQQCKNPQNKSQDHKKKQNQQSSQPQDKQRGQQKQQENQNTQQGRQDQKKQEDQQGQQGQEGQQRQDQQDQGDKQNQGGGGKQDEQQSQRQQAQAQQGQKDEKDISRHEAQVRLSDYEHNESPKEMLNLRGQFDTRPVLKDW